MKVIILTSALTKTAAAITPILIANPSIEISMILYNEQSVLNDIKKRKGRIWDKIKKIGLLGAINGLRMRKWYKENTTKYLNIVNIKTLAENHNIRFETVPKINCKRTRELFAEANADIGLSLGNGYIGKSVFTIPKYGMLNIHHEVLPDYQGAQSIIWQLYNNSNVSGYTIHQINVKIDQGNILYRKEIPIEFKKSLGTTVSYNYAKLIEESAEGLTHLLTNYNELKRNAIIQKEGKTYTTPSFWQYLKIYKNYRKFSKLIK